MQIKIVELDISADHDLRVLSRKSFHWTDAPVGRRIYTRFNAWTLAFYIHTGSNEYQKTGK